MRNIDTLSGIIIDWAKPMIDDIALQIVNGSDSITRANAWIRKYFPVSQNYSIWNDISFLALPLLSVSITPFLENAVNKIGITDEMIPKYIRDIADAMYKEAETKGEVKFLERYEFSLDDMKRLKDLIEERL
ncbi:MAG: hypothetical protein PUK03_07355 [Bacteroidales bacterium]|nr:hypothetical protein [Bacteroidales bacterium]